jgi:hypothetical protein
VELRSPHFAIQNNPIKYARASNNQPNAITIL